jgi:hypothetical protein
MLPSRPFPLGWFLLIPALCFSAGCTRTLTQQAVNRFTDSLNDKDDTELRLSVSQRFEDRALRRKEAMKDIDVLKIPSGKVKIVEVEEVAKNEVLAKAEVGSKEAPKHVVYKLTRDPKIQRWVVDDVTLTQETGRGVVSRSAIEQLDLVMSIRDFIDAWKSGEPNQILAVTSPELREQMEPLPPVWLKQIAAQISEQTPQQKALRPEARIKDDSAFVQVGRVYMEFQLVNDHWFVRDAALKDSNDEDDVRSVRKLATALHQSQEFLKAYTANDKDSLAKLATPEFHNGCLVAADLTQVPIPNSQLFEKPYEARQRRESLDLVLQSEQGTVLVSLIYQATKKGTTPERNAPPKVSEVSLAENGSQETRRLSAIFLGDTIVQLYAQALIDRDVPRLQSMSTRDFSDRVWTRMKPDIVQALPMPEIEPVAPVVEDIEYLGPTTQVTVRQGSRSLVYVLKATSGRVAVDDVLMPTMGRPNSLKVTAEHLIPVYEFIAGMAGNQVERLRSCSVESFNAMIWTQLSEVPELGFDPIVLLTQPLTGLQIGETVTSVRFGNGKSGAEVLLSRENGELKVHDVAFQNGSANRVELLSTLRRMATQGLTADGKIVPVKAETEGRVPKSSQRIQQAILVE